MRHNRRGEPIGRQSGVYLYGASRPEVCRKIDPVDVTPLKVRDQASTAPSIVGPNLGASSPQTIFVLDATERSRPPSDQRVESYAAKEWAHASGSAQIENVKFRSRFDGVRGLSQPTGRSRRR